MSRVDADDAPVLVVGSTGRTGRAVAAALATGLGLEPALTGVRAAYHLAPNMHPDEVGIARRVANAGVVTGLPRLVFHSVLHPDDGRMPHHVRKAEAEVVLREALGPRVTVLRPAAYHQNLVTAARAGLISVPYSLDASFTNVDLHDVAAVAVDALRGAHAGLTLELAGPEVLSVREMTEQAASALGRPVSDSRMPLREWVTGPGAGLSEQVRADLVAMFAAYDSDGLVGDTPVLPRLLGRAATRWMTCVSQT